MFNEDRFKIIFKYIRTHVYFGNDKVGLTIAQLAELSGVSNGYVSQLENSNYAKTPSREIISKLSIAFAEILNLPEQTIKDALLNAAGYTGRTDPRLYVPIVERLADTNFADFLQLVLGYHGMVALGSDPMEMANNAYRDWVDVESKSNILLLKYYKEMENSLLLNKADNPDTRIVLDHKELTPELKQLFMIQLDILRSARDMANK